MPTVRVLPVVIQVNQEIDASPPVPMVRVYGEVGVHVQESALGRLVQPASFQALIRPQTSNPRQLLQPLHERRTIQCVDECAQAEAEAVPIGQSKLPLVDVGVVNPLLGPEIGELLKGRLEHVRVQEAVQDNVWKRLPRSVLGVQVGQAPSTRSKNRWKRGGVNGGGRGHVRLLNAAWSASPTSSDVVVAGSKTKPL